MSKYVYIVKSKTNDRAIQDVAFSRSEARDMKNMYEVLHDDKYRIERFEHKGVIR